MAPFLPEPGRFSLNPSCRPSPILCPHPEITITGTQLISVLEGEAAPRPSDSQEE